MSWEGIQVAVRLARRSLIYSVGQEKNPTLLYPTIWSQRTSDQAFSFTLSVCRLQSPRARRLSGLSMETQVMTSQN